MPPGRTPDPLLRSPTVRVVVVAAGDIRAEDVTKAAITSGEVIIAADGGADACRRFGLTPSLIIGDMDSIDPHVQASEEARGCRMERYPRAKDQTDLELAMDRAEAADSATIVVLGALGGRWDMSAGNINLLAARARPGRRIILIAGGQTLFPLAGPDRLGLSDHMGATVSLIPVGQQAAGVSLSGMAFPLANETLSLGSTRGISNRVISTPAEVSFKTGRLLVVIIPPDTATE